MGTDNNATHDFMAIVFEFLEERERQSGGTLRRFIGRYPEYERELVLLASEMAVDDPEMPMAAPATAVRARMLGQARAIFGTSPSPLESLIARAQMRAGLAPPALAATLGIGVDVLAMLEERSIAASSIFPSFIRRLSEMLDVSSEAVRTFFAQSSTSSQGVAYRAPQGHSALKQVTFREAISQSQLMSTEQKARWLESATDSATSES